MEFVHLSSQPGETIAAIATPSGDGGVAIIRVSGNTAIDVVAKLFSGPIKTFQSHTVRHGKIRNLYGDDLDDVLVIVMKAPRSYTGEETVEIQCHGGSLISRRVLDAVLSAGARAAQPGEFSLRAFLNGKLDLAQAEAVQALIGAKNERALDAAEAQLQGRLSNKISSFQIGLTRIAAILDAWVDFPEEGLEFASFEEISAELNEHLKDMQHLADTFHDGRIIQEGIALCLAGYPNAGKSSLMNALLEQERAIVSPIPGTTRDIVEGHLRLNGINLRLLDTAGIRETAEVIEMEGIRRSREAMQQADLILLVLDASKGLGADEEKLIQEVPPQKTIVVWNKIDLPHHTLPALPLAHIVKVSAKEHTGLTSLHRAIDAIIWAEGTPSKEEVLIANVRHYEALCKAISAGKRVLSGLKEDISPEFLAFDMREALQGLGTIIGTNITEDILNSIFATFCIGK